MSFNREGEDEAGSDKRDERGLRCGEAALTKGWEGDTAQLKTVRQMKTTL